MVWPPDCLSANKCTLYKNRMPQILLIESDSILAKATIKALTSAGHEVTWHVDPQAATDSADKKSPDLVIIDLMLGGRSGVEFLYEFRSYPEWRVLPVIIYSSIEPEEFYQSSFGFSELGISHYHYKPTTSLAQLAESVKQVFQTTDA